MAHITRNAIEVLVRDAHGSGFRADLSGLDMRGMGLASEALRRVNMTSVDASKIVLQNADLREAILDNACLEYADLALADLRGASLRSAALTNAQLDGADLRGANLTGADLRHANLHMTKLTGANLRGVNLYGADLRGTGFVVIHGPGMEGHVNGLMAFNCGDEGVRIWTRSMIYQTPEAAIERVTRENGADSHLLKAIRFAVSMLLDK